MNEISDAQLRMAAVDFAVKYLNSHFDDKTNPATVAKEIYEFIKGETK